jgi:hypothetical protein
MNLLRSGQGIISIDTRMADRGPVGSRDATDGDGRM